MAEKYIKSMKGFKATNADMKCRDHQFELGKWYEIKGEIEQCKRGFHFCLSPSGVYAFYDDPGTRVFEIEAEDILQATPEAGADAKMVAHRIRLVKEITPGNRSGKATGDRNTGNLNTGNWNTGDRNTGNLNTGNMNTGNWNTGDRNTGNLNTGNLNTGDRNTGNLNTGNLNTGNWNTGDRNTGNLNTGNLNTGNMNTGNWNTGPWNTGNVNTGNLNTGDRNTGNWNTTNRSSGFFCAEEPKVLSFDVQTDLTYALFLLKYPEAYRLGEALMEKAEIRFEDFKNIPGITKAKLKKLHEQHLAGRKK
jgi:hypothetical protein